jgi:hypothetical protein
MNYCGNPLSNYYVDPRFLDSFETVNSKPLYVGNVETNYKYNPENEVDISLGIRERKNIKEEKEQNTSLFKYYFNKILGSNV